MEGKKEEVENKDTISLLRLGESGLARAVLPNFLRILFRHRVINIPRG